MDLNIILAIVFGTLFGFVLHRVGASNPNLIINMLRLKDFHLMKVILLGIGIASLLSFSAVAMGLLPVAHFSVKASYMGVLFGGVLLGIGWAISGFCPGTGVVAAGEGRRDAWFFLLGGLVGAFIYMLIFASIKSSVLFNSLGGKVTLAMTGNDKFEALIGLPGIVTAGVISLLFVFVAWKLPDS